MASALLLLAVVSALVAFQGWPGTGFSENVSSLKVAPTERIEVEGPVEVASNAASAAAAVANSPTPGTPAAGGPPPSAPTVSGASTVRVTTPTAPGGGAEFRDTGPVSPPPPEPVSPPPPDQTPPGLLPETPLSPQVNQLTGSLGDTTQGFTDGLGYTVGRLSPQLGATVTDTGRILAELLRGVGRTR